jgi:hypothetical protein
MADPATQRRSREMRMMEARFMGLLPNILGQARRGAAVGINRKRKPASLARNR